MCKFPCGLRSAAQTTGFAPKGNSRLERLAQNPNHQLGKL